MVKYALYLVTYERGEYYTGQIKPHHWAFFIQKRVVGSEVLGIAHQLHGMPGNFHYDGPENIDLTQSRPILEKLEIGEVDESKMDRVHEILKDIPIDQVESSRWHCQNWSLEGLERLIDEGIIYEHMTKDTVKNWLKEK